MWDCPIWFAKLWTVQMDWLSANIARSTSLWRIAVTHFPPTWGMAEWHKHASDGIDLVLSGHVHMQQVHGPNDPANPLKPMAWVISGGGGGITSEAIPDTEGDDDAYGFIDLTLTSKEIKIEAVSHGGYIRSTTIVHPKVRINLKLYDASQRADHNYRQSLSAVASQIPACWVWWIQQLPASGVLIGAAGALVAVWQCSRLFRRHHRRSGVSTLMAVVPNARPATPLVE